MTLSSFVLSGVIILVFLFLLMLAKRSKSIYEKPFSKLNYYYLFAFIILGVLAGLTVNKYMFPEDKSVFSNADYHIFEHRGFSFDSLQYLAREDFPDEALWDGKTGTIALYHDSIVVQNYFEPFFIEEVIDKKSFFGLCDCSKRHFHFVNNIISDNISDGFTLTEGADTLYSLTIVSEEKDKFLYISKADGCKPDTSAFKKRINKGIPLNEIITRSQKFNYSTRLRQLFEGSLLVREYISIDNNLGREKSGKNTSELKFSPGRQFFSETGLQFNGRPVNVNPSNRFVVPVNKVAMFYSGIGKTQTDLYKLIPEEKGKLRLNYVLPKMYNLRESDGKLFVTSSVQNAVESKNKGGYLFNIFENENNYNHINGQIKYFIGTSRDSMFFETMDYNAKDPANKKINSADNEFSLQSRMVGNSNLYWNFNFKDLRQTNSLQWHHFMIFIFAFIILISLRIFIDDKYYLESVSFIELAVYVVLLCFSIVRLILGWRMSTFVPIEDIAPAVFAKMRDGYDVWLLTCTTLLAPIVFIVLSLLKNKFSFKYVSQFPHKVKICFESSFFKKLNVFWKIIISFLLLLVLFFFLAKIEPLKRLFNIPFPVVAYLLVDLWLVSYQKNTDSATNQIKLFRFLIWFCAFVYFFFQDAGFSIIFLLFTIIHYGIFSRLLLNSYYDNKLINNKFFSIIFLSILFFLFLKYEGDIMIFVLNNFLYILIITAVLFSIVFVYLRKKNVINKLIFGISILIFSFVTIVCVLDVLNLNNAISDLINEKVHMKYRAEVQKLDKNETIDDLIIKSGFQSEDVNYILRSAHNQWFINQYNNEKLSHTKYFNIQPHFNQGSSYTTQTTDLVLVRYVIAEHGNRVIVFLIGSLLLLLIIYSYEAKIYDYGNKTNFTILGIFTLLFAIALFVFLSATNRIVFFGQDFPFLSITSKIAVLFPLTLFIVAVTKMMIDKEDNSQEDNYHSTKNKIWIPVILISLSLIIVYGIPVQGRSQNENQFDVSKIINTTKEKIEPINREFQKFQLSRGHKSSVTADSAWNEYTFFLKNDPGSALFKALNDSTGTKHYFFSLLKNFNYKSYNKTDPNQMIHLRKRGNHYFFAVNRKHYFIPSVMQKDIDWSGELLAAKTDRYFGFSEMSYSNSSQRLANTPDYEINIIPVKYNNKISNIKISRLDSSWISEKEPLLLISSMQATASKQFYHIESDSVSIRGSSNSNQIATRILKNDIVLLNYLDDKRNEISVIKWKYGQDDEHFLAKNTWLNGKQQLFYPLGKESMWSYHFANLVRDSYGKSTQYKDTTIRVSIDYDLHKNIYRIIEQDNLNKYNLDTGTINILMRFKYLTFNEQTNNNNRIYFDQNRNKLIQTISGNQHLNFAVSRINDLIRKRYIKHTAQYALSKSIDDVLELKYDFSAVAIDGNGRIRLLLDYSKNRKVDPNNFRYLNRLLSNLYKESEIADEREILGNKALQLIIPGPGSSFKPIAYTAITSQENINWLSLNVTNQNLHFAKYPDPNDKKRTEKVFYYGGVDFNAQKEWPWTLEYQSSGMSGNDYLTYSNNLYHSVMIMLGNQRYGQLTDIFKSAGTGAFNFPVFVYNGSSYTFDPHKWYRNGNMQAHQGILSQGLFNNFNLNQTMVQSSNLYSNFFGSQPHLDSLFRSRTDNWSYPETGSQNVADKNLHPVVRNGLIQMTLGSSPLQLTPLQMATMGMRLATLNKAKNITTLEDNAEKVHEYEFFSTPGWDSTAYFDFYKRQVLTQLKRVTTIGTARALGSSPDFSRATRNYHVYVKTGTLNMNEDSDERVKHLLVIISNVALENVSTINELKSVKYYSLFLSYYGFNIREENFSTNRYGNIIAEVINSELFQKYMSSVSP